MQVIKIIPDTVVDGPGLRTSIYFAGCSHQCKGCHNPESWDFDQGMKYSADELYDLLSKTGNSKVTLTGGDPLYQNIVELHKFLWLLKNSPITHNLVYNVWLYTGYTWEELIHSPRNSHLLQYIDVIVDGMFKEELKDLSLKFRGSSNQRIIDVQNSLKQNKIILYNGRK
jgi:anaerobic ribonucleoside-triphosphate reductase activating protein